MRLSGVRNLGLQIELAVFDAFDEGAPLVMRERQSGLGGIFCIPDHHLRISTLDRYAKTACGVGNRPGRFAKTILVSLLLASTVHKELLSTVNLSCVLENPQRKTVQVYSTTSRTLVKTSLSPIITVSKIKADSPHIG